MQGTGCPQPQLLEIRPLRLGLGPAPEAAAHDLGHGHEVVGVAGANRTALNFVLAVMLLSRQTVDEYHLGSHRIAALDVTDVIALDAARRIGQFEQLGQILQGQQVLFTGPLGPLQLIAGVAHHQLDQLQLGGPLRHRQVHAAAALLAEPGFNQRLLGQWVMEQNFGRNLHRLHLAVVLLHHPLQDQAPVTFGHTRSIGGVAQPAHQLACAHLEQLHGGHPVIGGQGDHIATHRAIAQAHLLIGCKTIQALQLIANQGSGFKV